MLVFLQWHFVFSWLYLSGGTWRLKVVRILKKKKFICLILWESFILFFKVFFTSVKKEKYPIEAFFKERWKKSLMAILVFLFEFLFVMLITYKKRFNVDKKKKRKKK